MKKILLLLSFLILSTSTYATDDTIIPFVDYVTNLGNGTYVVTFGFTNPTDETKNIPVSNSGFNKNYFNQGTENRNQPTSFAPGTHHDAFSINTSYGSSCKWKLTDKDALFGTKNITCKVTNNAGINMPGIGEEVTYNLKYNISEGTSLLTSKLIDTLPAGVTFVSCTDGGTHNNGVVTWPLGTLVSGAEGNKTVTVKVASLQPHYKNTGCIEGKMSEATYRGTGVVVNAVPVTITTDSSYIAAFEDLKGSGWNDWDVNDFVVGMRERVTYSGSNAVTKIIFDYEALARGSAFVNNFRHLVKLTGNSTATLVVKDSNGVVLPALSFTNQAFTGNVNVAIFPNTYNALPPQPGRTFTNTENAQLGVVKGYTATLTITTDGSSNTGTNYLRNSSQPYLINELNKQINIASLAGTLGNTQNVDNSTDPGTLFGYFLDLGYRLPYDWKWPLEIVPIWKSFPQYSSYVISSHSLNTTWCNSPDLSKVWTRRVVTDNFPFTGETGSRVHAQTEKAGLDVNTIPEKYSLNQNYPNPFNPSTKISFSVLKNEYVSVKIFDMTGKEVAQLVNNEMNAGTYEYQFNAASLTSGIYFYRISTPSFTDTKRMTLVK